MEGSDNRFADFLPKPGTTGQLVALIANNKRRIRGIYQLNILILMVPAMVVVPGDRKTKKPLSLFDKFSPDIFLQGPFEIIIADERKRD